MIWKCPECGRVTVQNVRVAPGQVECRNFAGHRRWRAVVMEKQEDE